jgi:hypothetical protein
MHILFFHSQLHVIIQLQFVPSAERVIWMRSRNSNSVCRGVILVMFHVVGQQNNLLFIVLCSRLLTSVLDY